MEGRNTLEIRAEIEAPQCGASMDGAADELLGFQFSKCLEHNALGECWELADASGERRLAHVLPANDAAQRAVDFLGSCGHEGLALVTVWRRRQRAVIVVAGTAKTLRERFREYWLKGLSGIPKKELHVYIDGAAATLDQLSKAKRVQHLDLRPETLLVQDNRLTISNFGLMHYLWLPAREQAALPNPRYAAPELFQPHISSRCDQYSLALIYAEMLTGVHPLRNIRDGRRAAAPDLGLLSSGEREVVARALSVSPSQRFDNLTDFVHALKDADNDPLATQEATRLDGVVEIYSHGPMKQGGAIGGSLDYFVSEVLLSLGAPHLFREFNSIRYKLEPGRLLEHHCAVRMFPGAALLKLEGFRQHWDAQRVYDEDGLLVFRLSLPPTFWQKLSGTRMGLEMQIQVVPSSFAAAHRSEVVVLIRPYGCSGKQAVAMLSELGPKILDSLRGYLQAQPEQRISERLPCNELVRVMPVVSGIEMAEPIECITKDVSSNGIGFFLSRMLPTSQVYINVPKVPELARFAGLAEIVRAQPCGEGWFEVGARFALKDVQ